MIKNIDEINRTAWLEKILTSMPKGLKILDAGAGELRNKKFCTHLEYVPQDFCQYEGATEKSPKEGFQNKSWNTDSIDIVSDIVNIPAPDSEFDVVLCSEVLEHVPDQVKALDEFSRLLKPGGYLILTAPFASLVHMAPFHFCTGFSKYWYQYHLTLRGIKINTLVENGDWFDFSRQELIRLGGIERKLGNWSWPLAYALGLFGLLYFRVRSKKTIDGLACFGIHVVGVKE